MAKTFHEKTGTMVTLTNFNRSARRNHPHQEFNNGVVISSEPLVDDQLFEVCIDRKVPTWSGSIEIGVTRQDPSILEFPSSAANLRDGSWVMSGTSILENGKSLLEDYGQDLDDLVEGDRVGVMRTSNGELHFYVNGVDQGVAASSVAGTIYAAVDMYGKCAQISIIDQAAKRSPIVYIEDRLHFHEHYGTMVKLSNGNRTAERKKPVDEFNNGVVMTHRPLKDDELFEIRIDELVNKWSGSIEMGITTHNPDTLHFPATMTNMRSGTIMMSGCGILTNGKGSRREYGEYNLDELHEGDRIGLIRKSNKNLHYYINGLDQGVAAEDVPPVIYGVVDLYGMTVKVSMTDYTKPTVNEPMAETATTEPSTSSEARKTINHCVPRDELLFHSTCGRYVSVINEGLTAVRPNCLGDFNNAVVVTNRPLYRGELFEVLLEQVVMKWAGSIEIGVTTHSAEELEFPSTMTNVRSGTWMMTGNGIMYNGTTIADEYGRNLDRLKAGDRVGVIVYEDGRLHFFVNGVDQGLAAQNVTERVYGVIDLYGQAAKASIVSHTGSPTSSISLVHSTSAEEVRLRICPLPSRKNIHAKRVTDHMNEASRPKAAHNDHHSLYFADDEDLEEYSNDNIVEPLHSFHHAHGKCIHMDPLYLTATRRGDYTNGLVFSAKPLEINDLFEIQVFTINLDWGGSMSFGVTTYIPETQVTIPTSLTKLTGCDTWFMIDSLVCKNDLVLKRNYANYFPGINAGDRVGVKVFNDDSLHFFINGHDIGTAVTNMPKQKLYVVADVYGRVEAIQVYRDPSVPFSSSGTKHTNEKKEEVIPPPYEEPADMYFHENHGRNIQLLNDNHTACRIASYNQGVVMSSKALKCDELFQMQIDNICTRWTGSLQIGVSTQRPDMDCIPITALSMRRGTWIICGDSVFHNGSKVRAKYGPNLDKLKNRHMVGIKIDEGRNLHLFVNGIDQGIAAEGIEHPAYVVVDVYGQCSQVTINNDEYSSEEEETEKDEKEKADVECDDIKEKISKPVSSSHTIQTNCDHQVICEKIKTILAFPETYFVPECVVCFCETCHKSRGDEPYFTKGDPPKDYAQPIGWCQFLLKTSLKAEKNGINEKWHVAFQGTRIGYVRTILENGVLLSASMVGFKGRPKASEKTSEDTHGHVLISPTIRYIGSPKFSPKEEFLDSSTKKLLYARVAFQVYVRPGSYTTGPQQIGARDPIDVHFSNNDLEWYTKEESSVILHSLLMRVDAA